MPEIIVSQMDLQAISDFESEGGFPVDIDYVTVDPEPVEVENEREHVIAV